MARRKRKPGNLRYLLLAAVIASALWGISHGASRIEKNVDIPVAIYGLPDDIVITEQSTSQVNVRVQGSRAALRNVSSTTMEYPLVGEGAKPGPAIYDVEVSNITTPPGVRIVSRSPARIDLKYETRGRKNVRVRADIQGEPSAGYVLGDVVVEPDRVWLAGARSQVLRLNEAVTELIDISGQVESFQKEVRLALGSGLVWMEEAKPIKVTVNIEAIPTPELDVIPEAADAGKGQVGG